MAAIADHYASIAIPSPKYLLEICSAQTEYFEKNEVYDYKGIFLLLPMQDLRVARSG
jgi:hypothetical protein